MKYKTHSWNPSSQTAAREFDLKDRRLAQDKVKCSDVKSWGNDVKKSD